MMATPARPPKDITPKRFFEEWLPAQLSGLGPFSQPLTIRVRLQGDEGGAWDLKVGEAGLAIAAAGPAPGSEPEVTVGQTVEDWKAITVGEAGAVDLAPPQSSPTDILFLDQQAQSLLGQVKGTVRFEVTGYNGRTWQLTVKFGGTPWRDGGDPDATISVDAETYAQILARTLPPPQAYFQGKVRLSGDVNLAMQLGMALMASPRFQ
jgi:putative sterol carrier protein